jgi:hypothetical protein
MGTGRVTNNLFPLKQYDVTVVEAEPALRYIAGKWFGYEQTEQHRIFVENPAFYVTARARLMANPNTGFVLANEMEFRIFH